MATRIVIEDNSAGICTWTLPEDAVAALAALPNGEFRALACSRIESLLKGHLEIIVGALLTEDAFDSLGLIGSSEIKLCQTLRMMI